MAAAATYLSLTMQAYLVKLWKEEMAEEAEYIEVLAVEAAGETMEGGSGGGS